MQREPLKPFQPIPLGVWVEGSPGKLASWQWSPVESETRGKGSEEGR